MKSIQTINGAWSDEENGWLSETLCLTGDSWLEIELSQKGRVVIKKSETVEGPWPKALKSAWSGPKFRIRIYGGTEGRYIKIITTEEPITIQLASI